MITRRQLLTGLAGGVAVATAAATLVRAKIRAPIAKRPHAEVVHPGNSDVGFYDAIPHNTGLYCPEEGKLTFVSAGVEVMRILPTTPPTLQIAPGVKVEEIIALARGAGLQV